MDVLNYTRSISACAPSSESIKYLLIDVRGHENNIKT
jgi:hypothetical protein